MSDAGSRSAPRRPRPLERVGVGGLADERRLDVGQRTGAVGHTDERDAGLADRRTVASGAWRPTRRGRSRRDDERSRGTPTRRRAGPAGTRTSISSSSSAIEVVKWPTKNSSAATTRSPCDGRTTSSASVSTATAGSSADASAWAMLPPIVPRLRIETWPMKGSASASTGVRSATSGDRSASRSRVSRADGDAASVDRRCPASDGDLVHVDELRRRASRIASIGTRLCPPARTLASSPCSASRPRTSSIVSGARVLERRASSFRRHRPGERRGSATGGRCCSVTSHAERREGVLDRVRRCGRGRRSSRPRRHPGS